MTITRFFDGNGFDEEKTVSILKNLQQANQYIEKIAIEKCYNIELEDECKLSEPSEYILKWILKKPQSKLDLSPATSFGSVNQNHIIIEVGPRFNFSTASSTNSVSICQNIGLTDVKRLELSIRYLIIFKEGITIPEHVIETLTNTLCDKMTQCRYTEENIPVSSFDERLPKQKEPWYFIPVIKEGREAINKVNKTLGLAFDDWDLDFYTNLFQKILKRDPTNVELFDCAQSNSEHSRHWFFKGRMIIDNIPEEKSLIQMIIDTQNHSNKNNTIKFSDNSSAIKGFTHKTLRPVNFTGPGKVNVESVESDLIFTAETHNMPTAVAPFSGATTGTGGRIRDVQSVGRGGLTIAGTAGYCVGNLNIPGYQLPYEDSSFQYPENFASPLQIIIDASNGASDYGNKYGEPVISGFAISYGISDAAKERDEYVKPIMFSGGLGIMDSKQTNKIDPVKGMYMAKIGGPVYRIGVGGGAASSVEVQGDNKSELDFNAVQRGDAEMENKLNRVVRACIEMGDKNPILAIHDQGAGGNGNVLKELVEPGLAGAVIFTKEFKLGDPTINALELWGAEYQENNAILIKPEDREFMEEICARERCPISFVGIVSGDGNVSLLENKFNDYSNLEKSEKLSFNMNLKDVLGDMPKKEYFLRRIPKRTCPMELPENDKNYNDYLTRVLSVLSVGSKRFLTNKVDRCVTGLVAQQQCVGALHTPLSDYGIVAVSHYGFEGIATSIGTQPIKGLISPRSGARMSVAEALTNLVFAGISELADVKCSGNWMWPAKLPGEGAKMFDACKEMCSLMNELNIAVDGGKDSLSMAARFNDQTVKSPGTLVVSTYAPCPDIRVKVTPDLKSPAFNKNGALIWVNIESKFRLGGSAFVQSFGKQSDECPDLEKTVLFKNAFNLTQELLKRNVLLAGHDISDGGLIVCLVEMAIAGLCGLNIDLTKTIKTIGEKNISVKQNDVGVKLLFSEEAGWVMEVAEKNINLVLNEFKQKNIPAYHIGSSIGAGLNSEISVKINDISVISGTTLKFLKQWERTSFEIEKLQMNEVCAIEENLTYDYRTGPTYKCSFNPDAELSFKKISAPIKVAVIREEGSNGDREMISTLIMASFEVHDVTMSDLLNKKTFLENYRGIVFPGGFSYADTLGSAKGWAASIMHSDLLRPRLTAFKNRKDTFSLGVCNGCQLMSLIGLVGTEEKEEIIDVPSVALLENKSQRYECRWSTVKIGKSNSIMLKGMSDSVLGCWIAHGEGRFSFKDDSVLKELEKNNCVSLHFVDDNAVPTEVYPMNPNGSPGGIAGICSKDGRHLAMMPHPERCSLIWQWPYLSSNFECKKSPWMKMFEQAYVWCTEN